ncbi:MAG: glycosyltransferase family 4 protein [Bacteroidia bacterium]|nr:glycosyltransferase family 4 protein [Bacteroidia bacterium]
MDKINMVVFAIHRPFRAPNERYRWMQYENYLKQNNINVNYLFIVNENDDKILFQSHNLLLKFFIYMKTFLKRWKQIHTLNKCDVIIIYRELHWFGFLSKYFLNIIRKKTKKIVFDFDDAIWLQSHNAFINFIKHPLSKTILYLQKSDTVIAGNTFLANFALQYNTNTHIIPTVVDTNYFQPLPTTEKSNRTITIGWMGSHSTISHLKLIIPILKKIKEVYPEVQFKFIAKKEYIPELNIFIEDWDKETEIQVLNTFDIGIMPLPDDKWSQGKCGLKILTYLACEIPCIASNVGVNSEIIKKTQGGFVCSTEQEWLEKLSLLISNNNVRQTMGKIGRKGIEKHYSIQAWKEKFLNTIIS